MGVELLVTVTLTNLPKTIQRTDLRKVGMLTDVAGAFITGRAQVFTSAADISALFGASAEVTKAATVFFSQNPQLSELTILEEKAADTGDITVTFNAIKDEDFFKDPDPVPSAAKYLA